MRRVDPGNQFRIQFVARRVVGNQGLAGIDGLHDYPDGGFRNMGGAQGISD